MNTVLHRDSDDNFAIVTTAESEDEFRRQFADAMAEVSAANDGPGLAYFLAGYLEPAAEIICKFRGYKSDVVERRTIIAGVLDPDAPVVTITDRLVAEAASA